MLFPNMLLLSTFFFTFCVADNYFYDILAPSYGTDNICDNFIEDTLTKYKVENSDLNVEEVYSTIRSFKLAAYYEATAELDRRTTELIKAEASEEYAVDWQQQKMGFILGSLPKIIALQNVADDKLIEVACETGFNVGYGVLNVLISNPRASIVSFDIFEHRYSPYAVRALQSMFPHRDITVIAGDATITVPNFFKKVGSNTVCDMAFVDSGPPVVRRQDIVNLAPHMNYNVRNRGGVIGPVPNMILSGGMILPETGISTPERVQTTLLNKEFTHVLMVDDLHTVELWLYYRAYVESNLIETLDLFPVTNTPCVSRDYIRDKTRDYYFFDVDFCSNDPNYVDPGFVDSIFVKSRYLKPSLQ